MQKKAFVFLSQIKRTLSSKVDLRALDVEKRLFSVRKTWFVGIVRRFSCSNLNNETQDWRLKLNHMYQI